METRAILHIASGFKPSVDGMGDFARLLGTALWKQHSIQSHFLIYRQPKSPLDPAEIAPNSVSYPTEPSPSAWLQALASLQQQHNFDCAVVHYGSYAFSRDGKPAAFVEAIRELARTTRVLVFFHEVYAEGMPWKRAFWTGPEQRKAVTSLLEIADVAFTSNIKFLRMIEPLNTLSREVIEIPIFSNIGEPENLRPLHQRTRRLIVFGQFVTRVRLYQNSRNLLEEVCQKLRIEEIVDVGSGQSPHIPAEIAGISLSRAGFMEEQELSDLMADSIAGIVGYWPDVWQKSGVIAAYQAHRLVPIMVALKKRKFPQPAFLPYISPEQVSQLAPGTATASDESLQAIADAAHDAYVRNQSAVRCADTIAATILRTA